MKPLKPSYLTIVLIIAAILSIQNIVHMHKHALIATPWMTPEQR
ncbi:hypothetical protein ACQZV8_09995 [Magnetococcales bacterium HHB-1]